MMNNTAFKYLIAYAGWIANLGLTLWLGYLSRITLLGIFALFYKPNDLAYANAVAFIDKAFVIALGLGWLIFMIISESKFRGAVNSDSLLKLVARVTGSVLLCIFSVDLILFWIQGIGSEGWLRWLVLAAELGAGIALLVIFNPRSKSKPN